MSCDGSLRLGNVRRVSNLQLAVQFFFQIGIILAFCQVVGRVARRLGQPQVVAEMIAGVMLGPSLRRRTAPTS